MNNFSSKYQNQDLSQCTHYYGGYNSIFCRNAALSLARGLSNLLGESDLFYYRKGFFRNYCFFGQFFAILSMARVYRSTENLEESNLMNTKYRRDNKFKHKATYV